VIAVVEVPRELTPYLDRLVAALGEVTALDAVYLLGSAALGAYEPGSSDVDVVAVTTGSLPVDERRRLAEAAEAISCPARKLELVVYPRGSEEWEINLNTGEHVSFDPAEEPAFWFVLDRAIAEQHAVPLQGPPWTEVFPPVPREDVLDALARSLAWHAENEPSSRNTVLNTVRSWRWLETGEWGTKPQAARWLVDRVRADVEAAR
jgi:predicted nucleotidyltransferase